MPERPASRLMIVDRRSGGVRHAVFAEIADALAPGDTLVLNDTRVLPARLRGHKTSGGRVDALLLGFSGPRVPALARSGKPLRPGQTIAFAGGYTAIVCEVGTGGLCTFDFGATDVTAMLHEVGEVPLPPYIRARDGAADLYRERYQTVYARREGSVAAPTAGLHFDEELLARVRAKGVGVSCVTLHVGPGTFRPIRGKIEKHRMEAELAEVPPQTVAAIRQTRARGGRIVAVGTTTARALESAARSGVLEPLHAATDLFIRPGYEFRVIDGLVTNFHLPRSTLLCLVMAFAGVEAVRRAYSAAVAERYRFYSFGDAMLVV